MTAAPVPSTLEVLRGDHTYVVSSVTLDDTITHSAA